MRNANKFAKSPIPQWSEKWKVTRNPYPGPDHHGKVKHFKMATPCPCLPCLVDVRGYRDREASPAHRMTHC